LTPERRAEILAGAAGVISYDEALAAKEALANERPVSGVPQPPPQFAQPFKPQFPGAAGGFGGGGLRDAMFQDLPPDVAEALRNLRDVPPMQRQEAFLKAKVALQQRADELTKEGKEAQAMRIREALERLQQMEERMRAFREGRGKDFGPRDPDKLKAEIKRLEDQGFKDQADKLRKELEGLEPKVDEKF
jgi:hypothetical protein